MLDLSSHNLGGIIIGTDKEEAMRQSAKKILSTAGVLVLAIGSIGFSTVRAADGDDGEKDMSKMSVEEQGKAIAFDRKKGNCLACHKIAGGSLPGNIGPELVNMKARYPDKAKLKAQIWDATANNPNTIMPPFGKYKILSDEELDKVVAFISTL